RTPLGPGLRQQFSIEQTAPAINAKRSDSSLADLASFVASPANPAAVRIFSLADIPLAMAWFDPGANAWQEADLPPLDDTQIACPACGGVLTVSFFDGLEQREYEWKLGSRWLLKPGPDKRKWVFEDVATLANSGN
ncbi:MAG TPA: hypothetical protein VHG92_11565, partial [Afifellaceae bacterium]|nr:hypothetical protein [Afifellaceae bacterium]